MKNLRVFYTAHNVHHVRLANRFHSEFGWKPVYMFELNKETPEELTNLKRLFPDLITQKYNHAIRGLWPEAARQRIPSIPLDRALLAALGLQEMIALYMLDRNDLFGCFGYKERLKAYHDQIQYWNAVLTALKPDLVFFAAVPHQICDFVIYHLARLKNIKTIMFNGTPFSNRISTMERYEQGMDLIIQRYEDLLAAHEDEGEVVVSLSEEGQAIIDKNLGDYKKSVKYYYSRALNSYDQVKKESGRLGKMHSLTKKVVKVFEFEKYSSRLRYFKVREEEAEQSYHKKPGTPFADSVTTIGEYTRQIKKASRRKKQLLAYYNDVAAKELNIDTPFIYFPIHFQPEATTSPLGGYYVQQQLAAQALAQTVPEGWKVYVKEHIGQFVPNFTGEPSRSETFYDQFLELPNVELVPLRFDSYQLIDKAKAVATITGSVSLEAVIRGKAVLSFGYNTTYDPCEGVFRVMDLPDLKEALRLVRAGYQPDLSKIKLYIQACEEQSWLAGLGGAFNRGLLGVDLAKNVEGHFEAIRAWVATQGVAAEEDLKVVG